jgi:hypothetical protein
MPIPLGIVAVAGAGAGATGSFDLLETTILNTSAASVTFSNLNNYSNYKHLQIRGLANCSSDTFIRFNGDTGANYNDHVLRGIGTSVQSTNLGTGSEIPIVFQDYDSGSGNRFGAGVVDILDFSNTSKYTTVRAFAGNTNVDVYPQICLQSGLWRNTAAVTSITISAGSSIAAKSRFSLYGIK